MGGDAAGGHGSAWRDILGHVGAWAPRPSRWPWPPARRRCGRRRATSRGSGRACEERLDALDDGFAAMRAAACRRRHRPAGRHLPLRAIPWSPARHQRSDPPAAPRARPASPSFPSRPSAFARIAAGSASRSAPFRWPKSTQPCRGWPPRFPAVNVGRRWSLLLGLALALRAALFPFAENKHGDAPMRALVAERMVIDPASAAVPAHLLPVRAAAHHADAPLHRPRSLRPAVDPLSLVPGWAGSVLAVLAVCSTLGGRSRRRAGDPGVGCFAAAPAGRHHGGERGPLPAAVGGGHRTSAGGPRFRAAPTARNAAIRDLRLAGALASLAAVTRYDAWLALPIMAAAAFRLAPNPRAALARLAAVRGRGGGLARRMARLGWGGRGDPLFFAHYISADHAGLAATAAARYGVVLGRLRQLGIWTLAFAAAMTPLGLLAGRASPGGGRSRVRPGSWPSPRWPPRLSISRAGFS